MTSDPDFWDDQYDAGTTGWDRGAPHPALDAWLSCGELTPCQIVLPGCGNGHEVLKLAQLGFDVTAIDFAEAPVNSLRSRLETLAVSADIHQADIFEFDSERRFDAVYEQTCLCAIEPSKRLDYAQTVFDWLNENGKLFVLFMQADNEGDGPPFHCGVEEMKTLFHPDRWIWPTAPLLKYEHPTGKMFEFAAVLQRRDNQLG